MNATNCRRDKDETPFAADGGKSNESEDYDDTDHEIIFEGTMSLINGSNLPIYLMVLKHHLESVHCIEIAAFLDRGDGSYLEAPHLYASPERLAAKVDKNEVRIRVNLQLRKREVTVDTPEAINVLAKELTGQFMRELELQYLLNRLEILSCQPSEELFEVTLKPASHFEMTRLSDGRVVSDIVIERPLKLHTVIKQTVPKRKQKEEVSNLTDTEPPALNSR
jgi:hypothetical protein